MWMFSAGQPALPDDLPWKHQQAFLLFDGATIPDLLAQVKRANPLANTFALYDRSPFSELRDLSPLLVAIDQPDEPLMQFFLQRAYEESGVLLFSAAPVYAVTEHLRKLMAVKLPTDQSALLRLADAAVMRAMLASADQSLFGPLTCVVSADCVNALWHCQRPRQAECPTLVAPYRLSVEQNTALDLVDRRRTLLELDAHLLKHFCAFHVGETPGLRWPMLEQIATQSDALGLSNKSELFNYANLMAWLDGQDIVQHPHIHHLLHAPSLQPSGERVALAAELAQRWANQRARP
jgi:hypothetical protein